jgi:hypothetical protein
MELIPEGAVAVGVFTATDYAKSQEESIKKAKGEGFEIIESAPNKLLLDLDSQDAYDQLDSRLRLLNKLFGKEDGDPAFTKDSEWRSKSGNWHVVIDCSLEHTIQARIAFELCLGSDPKRGMFGLVRAYTEPPNTCSVLFKPPAPKVKSWFDELED